MKKIVESNWVYYTFIDGRLFNSETGELANGNWPLFRTIVEAEDFLRMRDEKASVLPMNEDEISQLDTLPISVNRPNDIISSGEKKLLDDVSSYHEKRKMLDKTLMSSPDNKQRAK